MSVTCSSKALVLVLLMPPVDHSVVLPESWLHGGYAYLAEDPDFLQFTLTFLLAHTTPYYTCLKIASSPLLELR